MFSPQQANGSGVFYKEWKLYVISIGFALVLAPEYTLVTLQTSIGVKHALGSSNVLVYCLICVFTLLVYVPLAAWIGRKRCLVIGEIPSVIYTVAMVFNNIWAMTIAAILMGIAESVIMPAAGAIVTAFNDDGLEGTSRKKAIGVFLATLAFGQAVMSIVPKFILKDSNSVWKNTTLNRKGTFYISKCGSNDCPMDYAFKQHSNVFGQLIPTHKSLVLLISVFASLQIVGVVIHFLVIPDGRKRQHCSGSQESSTLLLDKDSKSLAYAELKNAFRKLLKHLNSKLRLMTIPIQLQYGSFSAFLWSEFTRAYISCPIGVENVGVCLFIVYTVSFIVNCIFIRFGSRACPPYLVIASFVFEIGSYTGAFFWLPSQETLYVPYLLSVLIGMTHAMRRIISYVTASVYFDDLDSSYIVQTGSAALGNAVVYAFTNLVCVYVKIYALALLSLTSSGLAIVAHYRYS